MANSLAKFVEGVYGIINNLDASNLLAVNKIHEAGNSVRFQFQNDFASFVMYLANSDERISKSEKDFISNIVGLDMTYDEIKTYIKQNGIDSEQYGYTIPKSVELIVDVSNSMDNLDASGSNMIYEFYKIIGQAVLTCNDSIDNEAVFALSVFLKSIKKYINANCKTGATISSNPDDDAKEVFSLCKNEKKYNSLVVERIIKDAEKKTEEEQKEFDRELDRIFSSPTKSSAPWEAHYFDSPCPYCGARKVRYSKWDDKAMSAAIWGAFSYKLHCTYKCDGCGEMWE